MIADRLACLLLDDESPKDFLRRRDVRRSQPTPRLEDVSFEVIATPEEESVEGQFDDEEAVQWVRDQLERGNEWAWCSVEVRASWEAPDGTVLTGSDYLGCCSYRSRRDFMSLEPGSYYPDMLDQAYQRLLLEVEKHYGH